MGLRNSYNIRLVPNSFNQKLDLAIVPGTIEAELAAYAAQKAVDQEVDRGAMDESTQRAVANSIMALRAASKATRTGQQPKQEISLRGEAAAAVVEGLGALSLIAEEHRAKLNAFSPDKEAKKPFEPAVEYDEEKGRLADAVIGELLDQAEALAAERQVAPVPSIKV